MIGTNRGTSPAKMLSTMWSPNMLPKSRTERDMGLNRWLNTSMQNMRGASRRSGPVNCLRYLMPCSLKPVVVVDQKHDHGHDQVRVDIPGGWLKTREDSQDVAVEDVEEQTSNEPDVAVPGRADDATDLAVDSIHNEFADVAHGEARIRHQGIGGLLEAHSNAPGRERQQGKGKHRVKNVRMQLISQPGGSEPGKWMFHQRVSPRLDKNETVQQDRQDQRHRTKKKGNDRDLKNQNCERHNPQENKE